MYSHSVFRFVTIFVSILLLSNPIEAVTFSTSTNLTSTASQNATRTISTSQTTNSGHTFHSTVVLNSTFSANSSSPTSKSSTGPSATFSGFPNTTASQTAAWYTVKSAPISTGTNGVPVPEPTVLVPATPPHLDPHDPVILQPNASVSLFYQEPSQSNASGTLVLLLNCIWYANMPA